MCSASGTLYPFDREENFCIAIDFETGGLVPGVHTPLSWGAVTSEGSSFYRLILPVEGLAIDPEAARINGYALETWIAAGAVPLEQAAADFRDFVAGAKKRNGACVALAHNSGFDRGFMDWIERQAGFEMGLSHRWECSMAALALLMRVGLVPPGKASLDRLCELAGIVRPQVHNALADARACLGGYAWLQQQIVNLARRVEWLEGALKKRGASA